MIGRVKMFKDLLADPGRPPEVREQSVGSVPSEREHWVEAILRYLVEPRRSGRVKTALTEKILMALKAEPDRVLFPKSNMR